MSELNVTLTEQETVKHIPVLHIDEPCYIKVRKPIRKARLNELYPQRAILEEARFLRKNANDFIDHDYYENELEKANKRYQTLEQKYMPTKDYNKKSEPMTPKYKVPVIEDRPLRRIPRSK